MNAVDKFIKKIALSAQGSYLHSIAANLKPLSLADCQLQCEFVVTQQVRNFHGSMHGGAQACLGQVVSLAHASTRGHAYRLARVQNKYMRQLKLGQTVNISSRLYGQGESLLLLGRVTAGGQLAAEFQSVLTHQ